MLRSVWAVGWHSHPAYLPYFCQLAASNNKPGPTPFFLMTIHQHRAGLSLPGDMLDRTKEAAQGEPMGMRGHWLAQRPSIPTGLLPTCPPVKALGAATVTYKYRLLESMSGQPWPWRPW